MDERTYFNSGRPQPIGAPKVIEEISGEKCPNCGCNRIFMIEIIWEKSDTGIVESLMPKGKIKGIYAGCPACNWASPCMNTVVPE